MGTIRSEARGRDFTGVIGGGGQLSLRGEVPETDGLVVGHGDDPAVRRQREDLQRAAAQLELTQHLAGRDAPDGDMCSGQPDQEVAVRREGHPVGDPGGVVRPRGQVFAGRHVPQGERRKRPAESQRLAVRRKGQRVDDALLAPRQAVQHRAGRDVVNTNVHLADARDRHDLAVGRQGGDGRRAGRELHDLTHPLNRGGIEFVDLAEAADVEHRLPVRGHQHGASRARARLDVLGRSGRGDVEETHRVVAPAR